MLLTDRCPSEQIAKELEQWIKKLKCSGNTGISIDLFPEIRIGIDPSPVRKSNKSYEVYTNQEINERLIEIQESGGETAQITFNNKDTFRGEMFGGLREGFCDVTLAESRKNVIAIRGNYKNGLIEGKARVFFKDRSWLEGYFKSGIQHGFSRLFDKKGRLFFVGNFQNGVPVGVCWKIIRGGGCVVGRVDQHGELTGCRIAYIYPDFTTSLVGTFSKGTMQSAQQAQIESIIEHESGIKIPIFSRPTGHVHTRQIGNFDIICKGDGRPLASISDPLVRDPYENKFLDVKISRISGAAEGIFAKQDIEVNTVLAFYNGSRADPEDFDPSTWETNNYRIFDPADIPNGTIDIPVWAQATSGYCGTLAHKCNHSFIPNGEFVVFNHPKFGLIPCITSIADIQKGGEILVGYGYDLVDSPEWYKEAWKHSIFAEQGVSYKDWCDCNIKRPIKLKESRQDA